MDAFARGLRNADKMIEEGVMQNMLQVIVARNGVYFITIAFKTEHQPFLITRSWFYGYELSINKIVFIYCKIKAIKLDLYGLYSTCYLWHAGTLHELQPRDWTKGGRVQMLTGGSGGCCFLFFFPSCVSYQISYISSYFNVHVFPQEFIKQNGEPKVISGRQERYEAVFNRYL